MNYPVERKNIYTSLLVNTLSPCIYEGLLSIYNDIKNKTKDNGKELKTFQEYLATIPKWNNDLINKETNRVLQKSKCPWLENLVKGVIKANIELLSNTTSSYGFKYLNDKMYKNARLNNFIHKCYIECAREIYNNPYLFYHKYKPHQIKVNQKEISILIKDCIQEAIRKMLPIQSILEEYLNRDFVINDKKYDNTKDSITDNQISDNLDESHINELVKRDILNKNEEITIDKYANIPKHSSINNITEKEQNDSKYDNKYDNKYESNREPTENRQNIRDSLDTQRLIQSSKVRESEQTNKQDFSEKIYTKENSDKSRKYAETYSNIDEMKKNSVFVSNESTLKNSLKNNEIDKADKLQYFKKYLDY
jgi:hypothetical protein